MIHDGVLLSGKNEIVEAPSSCDFNFYKCTRPQIEDGLELPPGACVSSGDPTIYPNLSFSKT